VEKKASSLRLLRGQRRKEGEGKKRRGGKAKREKFRESVEPLPGSPNARGEGGRRNPGNKNRLGAVGLGVEF